MQGFLNKYMEEKRYDFDIDSGRALLCTVAIGFCHDWWTIATTKHNITPQNELETVFIATAAELQERGKIRQPPAGWLDDKELVWLVLEPQKLARSLRSNHQGAKAAEFWGLRWLGYLQLIHS